MSTKLWSSGKLRLVAESEVDAEALLTLELGHGPEVVFIFDSTNEMNAFALALANRSPFKCCSYEVQLDSIPCAKGLIKVRLTDTGGAFDFLTRNTRLDVVEAEELARNIWAYVRLSNKT